MIITVTKPVEDILKNLAPFRTVFVVGCAACATKCATGGEEAVKAMVAALEADGKTVTGSAILDTPCDIRIAKKDLARSEAVAAAEAIVVLACGAGVQSIEKAVDKILVAGLNPVFIGTTERIGVYHEYCSVCGSCLLDKTGGICPVTRCAKGLVNGPCGGSVNGKCELDPERDCAWALIYEKLKKRGFKGTVFDDFIEPRSAAKPRSIKGAARPGRGETHG